MKDISLLRLRAYGSIFSTITSFADDLFDQSLNDERFLAELSEKYAQHADFLVAIIDGVTAGLIAFYANDFNQRTGFVSMLVVKPLYRGFGIGTVLLDMAISVCKIRGMEGLQLKVDIQNSVALRLYERNGFSISGRNEGHSVILSKMF